MLRSNIPFLHSYNRVQGYQFLHIFIDACTFCFSVITILTDVMMLHVFEFCISLMIREVEHIFTYLVTICISVLKSSYSGTLPILKSIYLFNYLCVLFTVAKLACRSFFLIYFDINLLSDKDL